MVTSNRIVEDELDEHLKAIEGLMDATAISFSGPLLYGIDKEIRDALEKINHRTRKKKLIFILETPGGFIEVVQRIVDILRKHFKLVEFVIPDQAMSAGTVLALSGDAIHMDYFSILGPIDPQVQRPGSDDLIPALGYLVQYERLIKKSKDGKLTTAELNYLINKFDPAELYSFEQARELSIILLKQWLVKYKFKNWDKTGTRGLPVTRKMKVARAEAIAKTLNETDRWHSHSRGISMAILRKDLKLLIDDFGSKPDLNLKIRTYHKLFKDYMSKRSQRIVIHTYKQYTPLI